MYVVVCDLCFLSTNRLFFFFTLQLVTDMSMRNARIADQKAYKIQLMLEYAAHNIFDDRDSHFQIYSRYLCVCVCSHSHISDLVPCFFITVTDNVMSRTQTHTYIPFSINGSEFVRQNKNRESEMWE